MKARNDLKGLLDAVRAYCAEMAPGETPTDLTVRLASGRRIAHPVPPAEAKPAGPPFVPNAFQEAILAALEGEAMRTDKLAKAVGDRRRLFRDDGLPELRERGLVAHHDRLGYYRTDAPPDELEGEGEGAA